MKDSGILNFYFLFYIVKYIIFIHINNKISAVKHCILRNNRHKFNELTARGLHYRGLQNRKDTIITVKKPWIANKRLDLIITVPVSVLEKDCPFSAAFRYNDIVT